MLQPDQIAWFAREVLPHEGDVRRWLSVRVPGLTASDLDDVVQESYARLLDIGASRIAEPRAYFFVTARRIAYDIVRRGPVVPIETGTDIEAWNLADDLPGPERHASARWEVERFCEVLRELPARCREAFLLKKIDDLSQREVAKRMGIAESTVEKHLSKALQRVLHYMTGPTPSNPVHEIHEERKQSKRD